MYIILPKLLGAVTNDKKVNDSSKLPMLSK